MNTGKKTCVKLILNRKPKIDLWAHFGKPAIRRLPRTRSSLVLAAKRLMNVTLCVDFQVFGTYSMI